MVDQVLAEGNPFVSLDALGDAIGTMAITTDEIDSVIQALELAGKQVGTLDAGSGVSRLRSVIEAARNLRAELGRSPTPAEIGARTGLSPFAVQHALGLAQVMQR